MSLTKDWWRGAVIYQVYPRSYKDTNGDGVGDLPGIAEKIPYIASLGVDAIWISPVMTSPMKDFGYDVSDYRDIDPLFGTLADFKNVIEIAHAHGLKIITDVIFSHTSDEHPWFQESRKTKDNPKADWYVWADPREDGSEPNNWRSVFGGSSWQYDSWRGQYYLHNFLKEQPDLNFHNPAVQDALLDITKFWLDFGVDGFRLDAINFAVHDRQLRDNPMRPEGSRPATQLDFKDPYSMQWHVYDKSQPEMLSFLQKLRALLNQYPDAMALGEVGDDDEISRAIEYSGGGDKLHTCYNFSLINAHSRSVKALREAVEVFELKQSDAWPAWAFSNHDVRRAVSRWTKPFGHDPQTAKMLIALLSCLRGSPFFYQGEELGLPDTEVAYEDIQDPWGRYLYPKWQGRDGCRTPMPWNAALPSLGFSDGSTRPWLPLDPLQAPLAVDVQEKDPVSTLNFMRAFLGWRKKQPVLLHGNIHFAETGSDVLFGFSRSLGPDKMNALFNLSDQPVIAVLPVGPAAPAFKWEGLTGIVAGDKIQLPANGFFIS